jgi:hypothetical protein
MTSGYTSIPLHECVYAGDGIYIEATGCKNGVIYSDAAECTEAITDDDDNTDDGECYTDGKESCMIIRRVGLYVFNTL